MLLSLLAALSRSRTLKPAKVRPPRRSYRPGLEGLEERAVPANLTSLADSGANQVQAAQTSSALIIATGAAFDTNYKVFSSKVSAYQLANLDSAFLHAQFNGLTRDATVPQLSQFTITLLTQQSTYVHQEINAFDPWYRSVTGMRLPANQVLAQLLLFAQSFQAQEQAAVPALVQEIQTGTYATSQTPFTYTPPNLANASTTPVSPVAPARVISMMNTDQITKLSGSIAGIQPSISLNLTASANPVVHGKPVSFTAQVSTLGSVTGSFTGTVTFSVDGVFQQTSALDAKNQATLNLPSLTAGNHQIQAVYASDMKFPDVSTTLTEQVT